MPSNFKFQISLFAWQIVEEGKKEEGAAQQFGPGPNGWVPIFNFLYLTVVFVSLSYFSNFFFVSNALTSHISMIISGPFKHLHIGIPSSGLCLFFGFFVKVSWQIKSFGE